jgi:tetratricopeptide (TPR) repeat protein
VLGPEHPDTLSARGDLAEALAAEGKYAEAEAEGRAVIKLEEKVLGAEHPQTLGTRSDLANTLWSEGKYAAAEAEYRVVLKLREKVLGPEHFETLSTCFGLAGCLNAEGAKQEATELAQREQASPLLRADEFAKQLRLARYLARLKPSAITGRWSRT